MKIYKYFLLLGMAVLGGVTLSSCGSDDDDDDNGGGGNSGGGSGSTAAVTIGNTGTRLTQVGNYTFSYDNNGRLSEIVEGYDKCQFTYSPNKIILIDGGSSGEYDREEMSVSYNGKGYISALSANETFQEDGATVKVTGKSTISYDGSGHITKITSSGTESGTEDGRKFTEKSTSTITFTWQSGNLTKVVSENTSEWNFGGESEKESYSETWTFDYGNNQYPNTSKQYSTSLADAIGGDFVGIAAMVGLFGVGPDYLPVSATNTEVEFYEGKEHERTNNYTYTYQFNNNGTISYASDGNGYGGGYNYSYDSAK